MTAGRSGAVLVLAAWVDEGGLRVRVTGSDDLDGPSRAIGVAADVDGACDVVRAWLEGVAAGTETHPATPPTTG